MTLSGYNNSIGLFTKGSIKKIKYSNMKIEISNTVISFYCFDTLKVFYTFKYYREPFDTNLEDRELDLYKALLAFDEKIISDIIDPLCFTNRNEYLLIKLSNTINDMILNMSK